MPSPHSLSRIRSVSVPSLARNPPLLSSPLQHSVPSPLRSCTCERISHSMAIAELALLALLLLGALFLLCKSKSKGKPKQSRSNTSLVKNLRSYTKEEVSKHNTRKDCWIIVKDKVYDVTPYVEEHPGGDAILNNAGRDSTEGFYGPQHATRVFDMVDEFYIGDLKN